MRGNCWDVRGGKFRNKKRDHRESSPAICKIWIRTTHGISRGIQTPKTEERGQWAVCASQRGNGRLGVRMARSTKFYCSWISHAEAREWLPAVLPASMHNVLPTKVPNAIRRGRHLWVIASVTISLESLERLSTLRRVFRSVFWLMVMQKGFYGFIKQSKR